MERLIQELQRGRAATDDLFAVVKTDALYHRPIRERHRIIFYVGHVEAFDWNLLSPSLGLSSFAPESDRLFAFGIDPVDGGLPIDTPEDWPALAEVLAYRDEVRSRLDAALQRSTDPLLLQVGIEHRLMHAETLAYMFHQLPLACKVARHVVRQPVGSDFTPEVIEVPAGSVTLGQSDAGSFGQDNEFQAHTVDVPPFRIDRFAVTNAQFARFVDDGGYENASYWTEADAEWKQRDEIRHPSFQIQRGGEWYYRSMFDEIPLPPTWPVYVSHAEASAYCRWAGKALPTEAEWQRAAEGSRHDSDVRSDVWDPWPVADSPSGVSAFGVHGCYGNGWEWTSTPFAPFQGFRPYSCYPGYSADFFDGKHYVMKGGSVRTARRLLRPSFRNWFQPHYPYVYATFRCVSR